MSFGQTVSQRYGNNSAAVKWGQVETSHFKIVFPLRKASIASELASKAELIYDEYKARLGTAPSESITLFFNDEEEVVSGIRAQDTDDQYNIWTGNPSSLRVVPGPYSLTKALRFEIAYAFVKTIKFFPVDYYDYLFAKASQTPWSDGIVSYLAVPEITGTDVSVMRRDRKQKRGVRPIIPTIENWKNTMLGRSQIRYFNQIFGEDSLKTLYNARQSLLGLVPYFDFNSAFKEATGLGYNEFEQRWEKDQQEDRKKKKIDFEESEQAVDTVINRYKAMVYQGAAVNYSGQLLATVSLGIGGSELQRLRISRIGDPAFEQMIAEGYFHPHMDWHPARNELVYTKRRYDDRMGNLYDQLYLWQRDKGNSRKLTGDQNVQLPAFSPEGSHVAYVEKTVTQNIIWLQNIDTGYRRDILAFAQPLTVTALDYHPVRERLLISYRQEEGRYRAGVVDIEEKELSPVALQADMPLGARWSPEGDAIYFNKAAMGVPNIFTAQIDETTLSAIRPVTSRFLGVELLAVSRDSSGSVSLLGGLPGEESAESIVRFPEITLRSETSSAPSVTESEIASEGKKTSAPQEKEDQIGDLEISPYNAFWNMQWEPPFVVPYYIKPGDFGLAGLVSLKEPMRIHEVEYYGTFSLADPLGKSFFYSSYVNNSFKPRIELNFNHFPSASGFLGKYRKVKETWVVSLSSLWKLAGISRNYNDWYAGLTLRHLAFDYFPEATLRRHYPKLFLSNREATQTDLRGILSWRNLKPNRHNIIHPPEGSGVRFSITGAPGIFESQTQYARFSLDGYSVLPAIGDHRLYVYANGVIDAGKPAGGDYLGFADNGDNRLPGPDFIGSVNPGFERFIRGYTTPLLGDRFLFGRMEYRIPVWFDTSEEFLGFVPPARTSLTFFADGGIMGGARVAADRLTRRNRYSTGIEIKRVFSFGGSFEFTYEFGIAQPLNKKFEPHPYVVLKSALPF